MVLQRHGCTVPVVRQGSVQNLQMLLAGLLLIDHAYLAGHDAEAGVQAGDTVVGRAQILVGQGAHQQLVEIVVRLAEILDALAVVHQLGIGFQLLAGDGIAVSTQSVWLHQQTHFKHTVHVLFGDAGDHQPLFGQNGDQPLLLQTPQRIPHGGAADVAHLGAELLLVQKLVGAVLAVQDLGLEVLVRLQLQAELCLCVLLFHKHTLLFFFVFFSKKRFKTSEPAAQTHRCQFASSSCSASLYPGCNPTTLSSILFHIRAFFTRLFA